jgi:hypothetical protein
MVLGHLDRRRGRILRRGSSFDGLHVAAQPDGPDRLEQVEQRGQSAVGQLHAIGELPARNRPVDRRRHPGEQLLVRQAAREEPVECQVLHPVAADRRGRPSRPARPICWSAAAPSAAARKSVSPVARHSRNSQGAAGATGRLWNQRLPRRARSGSVSDRFSCAVTPVSRW